VLFCDVEESSRLVGLDVDGYIRRWDNLVETVLSEDVLRHGGAMIKSLGDGLLLEFRTARDAVACAFDIQERARRSEATAPPGQGIRLRIGIHVTDTVRGKWDLHGLGVNLAHRLMDLGKAQEIIISAAVRDEIADGLDVAILDLGEHKLKGIEAHVRAFKAGPAGAAPSAAPDLRRRAGDRPSIAVLPFGNLSGVSTSDFLGDLIADDLITHLSHMTDLFVISRLSTKPFRDRLHEPRNVAEALGVRYVLTGSLYAVGAQRALTVELTDAQTGHVLWSDTFRGLAREIFKQVPLQIALNVVPHILKRERQDARIKRPEDLTAYQRTVRAIDYLHRSSRGDMEEARGMLEGAIAIDPEYAAPRAWLARWYVLRVGQGWSTDRKSDEIEANRHVEDAMARDETDPWVISVHGLVAAYLHHDLEKAIDCYDRALSINRSAASAWVWSTSALAWLGRGEDAVERSQRAIELSPFDPHRYYFNSIAGTAYAVAGNYEQAIEFCQRALRENRMFFSAHRILTISLALAGRLEDARRASEELMRLEPNLTVRGWRSRYPGSASEHTERFAEALGMAGIPR